MELKIYQNISNDDVKNILQNEADILIDQIIFTGYAMNALEGMSTGLPTLCNLEDENYCLPFRRWSYLNECPIVSASPENLQFTLKKLIKNPNLRKKIGQESRKYIEKYHDLDSAHYLFSNIIDYIHENKSNIINLYHPLSSKYSKRLPKINNPYTKNS